MTTSNRHDDLYRKHYVLFMLTKPMADIESAIGLIAHLEGFYSEAEIEAMRSMASMNASVLVAPDKLADAFLELPTDDAQWSGTVPVGASIRAEYFATAVPTLLGYHVIDADGNGICVLPRTIEFPTKPNPPTD